ncbi:SH3 domain-containing protein [Streptomyces bambusae]|uniref:SH3 domain-containing protein n=1 Tax=Streptomyces bambusae TaxID=1550616 RepID=A0ABS6Z420_9ACTN|nr:SH3 domain-containing protein [Streptomyces bambusae]MBW5482505.1 SH3 domain-containing protein [Streptomyces bambusae]
MRDNRRRALAAATLLIGAVLTPVVAAGPAAAAPTACSPSSPGDKDNSSWVKSATANVNMRSGPSTDCRANGVATPNHKLDYHCYKVVGSRTWTYVRNDSTGVKGWIRDDNLRDRGSLVKC